MAEWLAAWLLIGSACGVSAWGAVLLERHRHVCLSCVRKHRDEL